MQIYEWINEELQLIFIKTQSQSLFYSNNCKLLGYYFRICSPKRFFWQPSPPSSCLEIGIFHIWYTDSRVAFSENFKILCFTCYFERVNWWKIRLHSDPAEFDPLDFQIFDCLLELDFECVTNRWTCQRGKSCRGYLDKKP